MSDDDDLSGLEEAMGDGATHTVMSMDMLKKRLVWDIVPCEDARKVAALLEMNPASDDVEEMEHQEAHARLDTIGPLGQLIQNMSFYSAEALHGAMLVEHGDEIQTKGVVLSPEMLSTMVFSTSVAILSELVDMNIVHLPHMGFYRQ